MADISSLSAEELMSELRSNGLNVGPITPTTRRILEGRLARARGEGNQASDIEEISVISTFQDERKEGSDTCDGDRGPASSSIEKTPSSSTSAFHYGVCFDRCNEDGNVDTEPAVFTSQQKALQAVKQLKGARFKHFKTREEAERFSLSSVSSSVSSPGPFASYQKPLDPVGNFKKPTPQELIKFRKIIEQGNYQEFLSIVNSNPKYLISSGDTPVILQEGSRYNAMHTAAKDNKTVICKLIVDTIESDRFWQHYLSAQKDILKPMNYKRKRFLVDLYLNTPDKGNFETPLHFACKFGHVDVVKYLVSHPLTNITPKNPHGDTPQQVACSRCSSQTGSVKVMEKIKHLLEDDHYVPVFGSEGDTTPPSIGDPWSPDIHHREGRPPSYSSGPSPLEPKVTVRAYAGPMSPSKAAEFHRQWKTPPTTPEERKKYKDIRRGDSTRGVERIGRSLAHAQDIPWAEYWSFLGTYVDLAKPSGLERLEEYFNKEIVDRETDWVTTSTFSTPVSLKSDSSCVFMGESTTDFGLSPKAYASPPLHVEWDQTNMLPLATKDSSQNANEMKTVLEGQFSELTLEDQNSPKGPTSKSSSSKTPDRIYPTEDNAATEDNDLFSCKKNLLTQLDVLSIDAADTRTVDSDDSVDSCFYNRVDPLQRISDPGVSGNISSRTMSSHEMKTYNRTSSTESSDIVFHDRKHNMMPLFINGCYPSKTDLDAVRALEGVSISCDTYPLVSQWRDQVLSYTSTTRESWPSPGSPLCRSRYKSIVTTSC